MWVCEPHGACSLRRSESGIRFPGRELQVVVSCLVGAAPGQGRGGVELRRGGACGEQSEAVCTSVLVISAAALTP